MIVARKSVAFTPMCLAGGALLVSAALFAALSITPGGTPEAPGDAAVKAVVPASQDPIDPGFDMPPAKSFVEIVTRPIFASNRRPTPEQELTIETMSSELELRLIGVIVASGTPIAIVAPRGSDNFARVMEGDRFQGWTVERIEPHRVTFRRDKAVERIELSYDLPPTRSRPAKAVAREDGAKKD